MLFRDAAIAELCPALARLEDYYLGEALVASPHCHETNWRLNYLDCSKFHTESMAADFRSHLDFEKLWITVVSTYAQTGELHAAEIANWFKLLR